MDMKNVRQWIDQISSDCEDDVDFQERLIEEIIKPLAKKAFEAGQCNAYSSPGFPAMKSEEWIKENLK